MIGCLKVSIFGVFGCVSLVSSLAWIALEPKNHSIEIRNIILNPSTFHFHHFFVFHLSIFQDSYYVYGWNVKLLWQPCSLLLNTQGHDRCHSLASTDDKVGIPTLLIPFDHRCPATGPSFLARNSWREGMRYYGSPKDPLVLWILEGEFGAHFLSKALGRYMAVWILSVLIVDGSPVQMHLRYMNILETNRIWSILIRTWFRPLWIQQQLALLKKAGS